MSTTAVAQYNALEQELIVRREKFKELLPSHITPDNFQRVALTAVSQNPSLLNVDRRSLINALMRCAFDGLLPDGRQAAMVIYGSNAQYQQMVAGVRKLVQQSGEITRFEQYVVHENDHYEELYGTETYIRFKPTIEDRGEPILVFSIAQFKDGTLSYERMSREDVQKVRSVSRAKNNGPWVQWPEEMWKKTIAKRHAKVLPMSTDAANALADDDAEHSELPAMASTATSQPPQNRPRSLADKLDALGTAPDVEPTQPKRGRRQKPYGPHNPYVPTAEDIADAQHIQDQRERTLKNDDLDEAEIEQSQARLGAVLGEGSDARLKADLYRDPIERPLTGEEPELQTEVPDDGWPGPVRHDYEQGKRDAIAGRTDCLNREIRDVAMRYAEWRKGYESVKRK